MCRTRELLTARLSAALLDCVSSRSMGLFDRLRGPGRTGELHIGDPRFDGWEVVREFEEIGAARSWRDHLTDAGIDAEITADHEPDRFGRGDIYLQVPPEQWSYAEEFLSNLDLD